MMWKDLVSLCTKLHYHNEKAATVVNHSPENQNEINGKDNQW